jgi:uncharacterized membrane protein YkvA (DUF1232 family)
MTNGRRVVAAILVGVGALVYGISPVDIIPELLTGPFGFIDDLGVLGVAGFAIYKLLTGRGPSTGPTPPPAA